MKYLTSRLFRLLRTEGSKGTAYVELVLSLPLLLCLGFGSIELAQVYKMQQSTSTVSWEGANAGFRGREGFGDTYRQCAFKDTRTAVESCLGRVGDSASSASIYSLVNLNYAQRMIPGAEVVLSVFRYNPGDRSVELLGQAGIDTRTGKTPQGRISRYRMPPADPAHPNWPVDLYRRIPASTFSLSSLNEINRRVVVSEVFYHHTPLVSMTLPNYVSEMFNLNFYEVTIF